MDDLVERFSTIIRAHHRTYVRQPSSTNEPRRTFHQGDVEAATDIALIMAVIVGEKDARITALEADKAGLVVRLGQLLTYGREGGRVGDAARSLARATLDLHGGRK